jgi:hypothetical protein
MMFSCAPSYRNHRQTVNALQSQGGMAVSVMISNQRTKVSTHHSSFASKTPPPTPCDSKELDSDLHFTHHLAAHTDSDSIWRISPVILVRLKGTMTRIPATPMRSRLVALAFAPGTGHPCVTNTDDGPISSPIFIALSWRQKGMPGLFFGGTRWSPFGGDQAIRGCRGFSPEN